MEFLYWAGTITYNNSTNATILPYPCYYVNWPYIVLLILEKGDTMSVISGIFTFAICLFVYFLPSIIGGSKKNIGAIFALNLLLGWTLIGWIVALIWALTKD